MKKKDRLFDIWFSLCCGPANPEMQTVFEHYRDAYDVFSAEPADLEALPVSPRFRAALSERSLQAAADINAYCRREGIGMVAWQDEEYPSCLRTLEDPPYLLYYRGKLPDFDKSLCCAVVGTRTMSEYGRRISYKIGYELGAVGGIVVSGMALGNDSTALAGALLAGGRTVAILGSGIDVIYPTAHATLYREIARHGAIISEYPPGTSPNGRHFPVRNRLISGLSQVTVVTEASENSGALITAKHAIRQGRGIYAFPGNVDAVNADGTNRLIRDGARMVVSTRDLLGYYPTLYCGYIDLHRLEKAEMRSEPDAAGLARLGIMTALPKPAVPAPETYSGMLSSADRPTPSTRKRNPTPKASPKPVAEQSLSTDLPLTTPSSDSKAPVTPPAPAPDMPPPAQTATGAAEPPASPTPTSLAHEDTSINTMRTLTDTQRRLFEAFPLDRAVSVDYFAREGFAMKDIMATLTLLEIKGLVISLSGGNYMRK